MTVPNINNEKLSDVRAIQAEIRIRELEKKIAELVRENEQFTYIVSHDLQAPLRTITGFLELIERRYADKLDDAGRQYIDFALQGSGKLKTLVFDLLELSRLNTRDFSFELVNVTEIIKAVLGDLGESVRSNDVEIHCDELPVVNADRKLLYTLFWHLLDNAIKFRMAHPLLIRITAEMFPDCTLIHIADNGIGMDPAFLEKIFVIFRKLNTDEQRYPGSGKGLAICKKIAELHGWGITASSAPGSGTDIILRINNAKL